MAAMADIITNIMKKVSNPVMGIPNRVGTVVLEGSGYKHDKKPANILEAAADKNHTPIKRDMNLAGESLVTADSPIGDKQSSPKVIITYMATSQSGLTVVTPASIIPAGKVSNRNPPERKIKPMAILEGSDGSRFLELSIGHNMANKGANIRIASGLTDWNQLAGII